MQWSESGLTDAQVTFVRRVLPAASVVSDDSWGLLDTRVFHVRSGNREYTVKACGPQNTHFARELAAHQEWTGALVRRGDTSRMVAADVDARVLVLDRIPGHLALTTPDETSADLHRQAGTVLRRLHDQTARIDEHFLAAEQAKVLAALDTPHRIAPASAARARSLLQTFTPGPVTVVPTHGDWHPRNWIVHDGRLHAVDFGRFAFRPPAFDLTRLAVLHWQSAPSLEQAFFAGYGDDPREPDTWRWLQLREAVGTAVWAFAVDDETFEAQGLRMVRDALAAF